jgi:hypothetical protein
MDAPHTSPPPASVASPTTITPPDRSDAADAATEPGGCEPSTAASCAAVHVTGFFRVADIDDDRDLRPCCDLRGPGVRATATYDADSEPSLRGTYPADLEDALLYVAAVEWEAHVNGWGSTAWPDGVWAWVVGPRGQHEAVTERAAQIGEAA